MNTARPIVSDKNGVTNIPSPLLIFIPHNKKLQKGGEKVKFTAV